MPGGTRAQLGNELFGTITYQVSVTPPATVTTAVITSQTYTLKGVLIGDLLSWNIIAPTSNLLSIANMYVSAPDTVIIGWSTEGGTVSSAAAQQILIEVCRPENASLGLTALPAIIQ
jgi:hypothetical protein